jgi:hypothetical protein
MVYDPTFGTFGTFGSPPTGACEDPDDPGKALRFLAGVLRLDQELLRSRVQEWATKNGISELNLLDAAERLGVTRTIDETEERWRLEGQL